MSRYFEVDSILAEEERVPVIWKRAAAGCGHLDPSCGVDVCTHIFFTVYMLSVCS